MGKHKKQREQKVQINHKVRAREKLGTFCFVSSNVAKLCNNSNNDNNNNNNKHLPRTWNEGKPTCADSECVQRY